MDVGSTPGSDRWVTLLDIRKVTLLQGHFRSV